VWKPAEILDVNARIAALTNLREKSPGLFVDAFYISRIGSLLGMSKSEIEEEIERAQNQQSAFFSSLTGGAGTIPIA